MNFKRSSIIHKICEPELVQREIEEEYDLIRILGEGNYGRVELAIHRSTSSEVALKSVRKNRTKYADFLREFHYSYSLSPHVNILISYNVAFQTASHFVFAQEFAPHGDLARFIDQGSMDEIRTKLVIKQITSALDFMHSQNLVHRDVKASNVLVFEPDVSLVKLTDFGSTRTTGTLVKKSDKCSPPSAPPEVCNAVCNEGYYVETSSDAWQLAMFVFSCLKGSSKEPWKKADITDSNYTEFVQWQKRKSVRVPKEFQQFSVRLNRLFRRLLHPKWEKRAPVREVYKYLDDKWMKKEKEMRVEDLDLSICQKKGEKEVLGKLLRNYGVDVIVNRETKRKWIHRWIMKNNKAEERSV